MTRAAVYEYKAQLCSARSKQRLGLTGRCTVSVHMFFFFFSRKIISFLISFPRPLAYRIVQYKYLWKKERKKKRFQISKQIFIRPRFPAANRGLLRFVNDIRTIN